MNLHKHAVQMDKKLATAACKKHTEHMFINMMCKGLRDLMEEIPSLTLLETWSGWQPPEIRYIRADYEFYNHGDTPPTVNITVHLEADFDDLITFAHEVEPNHITSNFYEIWESGGIVHYVKFRIRAEMNPDYKTTLYNLGHIRMSSGYSMPGSEQVYCAS